MFYGIFISLLEIAQFPVAAFQPGCCAQSGNEARTIAAHAINLLIVLILFPFFIILQKYKLHHVRIRYDTRR